MLGKRLSPKRILVAEGDLMVAHTLRMALTVDGHEVELADDGEQALARFEGGKHDLVIANFKMAKMDGLELAEAIKRRSQSTQVILLTDYTEGLTAAGGPVSNVDVVLRKPCSISELQASLEKLFS
jgi:two-component system response regulator VicR